MLDDMSYLSIFFRLFNFVIAVAIFAYIFKRYLLKNIIKQIQDRMLYLKNLKDENTNLSLNIEKIDSEILKQDKLAQDLLQKLDQWKSSIELQKEQKLKEYKIVKSEIENKQQIKNSILTQKVIYNLVIPDIIEANKAEILDEFSNKKESIRYQKEIIDFIKKTL